MSWWNKGKEGIVSSISIGVCSSMSVHADEVGEARILTWNLVDAGHHMDYTLDSKYSVYCPSAADIWNRYLGDTVIREDSSSTIADVDIYDVCEADETWNAITIWIGEIVTGTIKLNTYYMDNYSASSVKFIIAHEFGHTLGCDENDCSVLNVMYPTTSSNIALTVHDKALPCHFGCMLNSGSSTKIVPPIKF